MSVVNGRYNGDHELWNTHMYYNLIISACLTVLGLLNCLLIKKYVWWRDQVCIINTIIICSYMPFYYTYVVDEVFMLCIPMHVF